MTDLEKVSALLNTLPFLGHYEGEDYRKTVKKILELLDVK